ncbi:calcium-dependent phosphoinositide phospholipase C [Kineococcus xinjiangensis]|uniref:Calcium-dependent phosphoinositide phospholipase C n=1 Tax=Kineococcus xinjiangensis TaxID=512762 RepID=A0A2S6IKB2_9ACTN|nr:phosphatidylinositol-specific phospholipase C1-like protein [Kineococcus xinjiangensis]PPK94616.1 calcium-dependent phosphoinositide phospholipase C [Kineococcus xinjiangensis]
MSTSTRSRGARLAAAAAATALAGAVLAVSPATASPTDRGAVAAPEGHGDQGLRLHHLQVVGSHNSYHRELPRDEQALQVHFRPEARDLFYSHADIPVQLEQQAVRSLELDLFPDPAGGLYRHPLLRKVAGKGPLADPAWSQPGTKVLHIADFDYGTTCVTLLRCLREVEAWSEANPGHVPLPILLELKESDDAVEAFGGVQSPPWDAARLDALDAEIRSVFGEEDMITPDDVRRPGRTLNESVLAGRWPRVAEARGQVLFLLDSEPGPVRDAYRAGRPSLQGRVMFTNGEPGAPDTAFLRRNDPAADGAEIAAPVRQGYLVRTRADVPLRTVLTGDTTQREAAFASGAHVVSTDFPAAGMAARYGSDYVAQLPGGAVARCNPVTAPRRCALAVPEP